MKFFRAIFFTVFTFAQVLGAPLLDKYYTETLKVSKDSMIGIVVFEVFYFIFLFIIMIILYVLAIRNKEFDDFHF